MPERIGGGWQYKVYEMGESRVRKEPRNRKSILVKILFSAPQKFLRPWNLNSKVDDLIRDRKNSIEKLKSQTINFGLLAEPEFEGDGSFTQSRVKIAEDRLKHTDKQDGKQVIEDYIQLVHECWRYGFVDETYNFTINTGYNSENRLVQADLGELNFSKEEIREQIIDRKWLNQRVYRWGLPRSLRPYFKKRMAEEITVEKLEDKWREKYLE